MPAPPPSTPAHSRSDRAPAEHPNGAIAIDHVVAIVPDLDRAAAALAAAGIPLTRITENRGARMGLRRLGEVILEVVEGPGPQRWWGFTVTVGDLATVAAVTGPARAAIQPGRRIATVTDALALSTRVAFMTP